MNRKSIFRPTGYILLLVALICLISGGVLAYKTFSDTGPVTLTYNDSNETPEVYKKYRKYLAMGQSKIKAMPKNDRPDLALLHDWLMTQDPALGYPPAKRKVAAFEEAKRRFRARRVPFAAIPGVQWIERGPDNVGGRTRAIMFDPNDPTQKKVWAGGISGGLWWTDDITDTNAQWHVVNDLMANLAISSIAYDSTTPNIFYAGTGEGFGSSFAAGGGGAGIWRSIDGGATWNLLPSTSGSDFDYVLKIVVDPAGDVYAAVRNLGASASGKGIMRSQDDGATWTEVIGPNTGSTSGHGGDIEIGADGTIYASLGIYEADGVYSSSTGDAGSWTKLNDGTNGFPTTGFRRMELATAPSNLNTIYATTQADVGGGVAAVYKSVDKGANWTATNLPATGADAQAWYDLILGVDPNDDNTVFLGVVGLNKTTDGGTSWTSVGGIHSDHHAIVYKAGSSSEAVFGNDGGVYYTSTADQAAPVMISRNNGYNVTQFYSCATENTVNSNYFLGGTQDNGTQKFTSSGMNSTTWATGGDGGYCFIDQDDPNYQITSYQNGNRYNLSTNGGNNFSSLLSDTSRGLFINPADYDDDADILYAAGNPDELVRISGITSTPVTDVLTPDFSAGRIMHVRVSPHTNNRIFVGTIYGAAGDIFMIDGADTTTPVVTDITGSMSMPFGVWLTSIEVGESDDHLLATFSNYGVTSVWETFDATAATPTWIDREGNLPDMPVRWALFNPFNYEQVMLATEVGIWSTDNINVAAPDWQPTVAGLANVRSDMIQYRDSDQLVLVATHGRGLFTSDVFGLPFADFIPEREQWFANKPLRFTDRSRGAISWEWDLDGDGTADDTAQHPQFTYTAAGSYSVTLTVNGDPALTSTKTVSVFAEPTIPYMNDFNTDGGGFYPETIAGGIQNKWEWGAASMKPNFTGANVTIDGAGSWITNLTGGHGTNTKYSLESPPFSFAGGTGDFILEFQYRAICGTNAGMNVESSIDGGNTWQLLGSAAPDPKALQGWYDMAVISGLDGQPGWFHQVFTVFDVKYDLNDFIGESDVRLRFVFGALGSQVDGFQLDNFKILNRQDQTITFDMIPNKTVTDLPITLGAVASSGLPVTYTVVAGLASLAGNVLTISGLGDVTVEASQPGDDNYKVALPVEQSFNVRSLIDTFLVLDRSGSMIGLAVGGDSKMARLKSAVSLFISLTREDTDDKMGIVQFNFPALFPSYPSPTDYVTHLSDINSANKQTMETAVNALVQGGLTSIGSGLELAFQELTATDRRRIVLLLSDGVENQPPYVDPANGSPTVNIPPNIEIYTVGLGLAENMNTDVLSQLPSESAGFFNLTQADYLNLHKFFISNFGDIFVEQQVVDPAYELSVGQDISVPADIVSSDKGATFIAYWTNRGSDVRVDLITPAGDTITKETAASHGINYIEGDLYAFYRVSFLPDSEWVDTSNGTWKLKVTADALAGNVSKEAVSVSVLAPSSLTFMPAFDKGGYSTGDKILISAEILDNGQPTKADAVSVSVTRPDEGLGNIVSTNILAKKDIDIKKTFGVDFTSNRKLIKAELLRREWSKPLLSYSANSFALYDDGQHGDGLAGDGVWANYYDNTDKEGVYEFFVRAKVRTGQDELTTRERTLSTDVAVRRVDMVNTKILVELLKDALKGFNVYRLSIVPKDRFGNYMGPGNAHLVAFDVSDAKIEDLSRMGAGGGVVILDKLKDDDSGKYSQKIAVQQGVDLNDVDIKINVSKSQISFNLAKKLKEQTGPVIKWWWLVLIGAIVLAVIAFIYWKRRSAA